MFSRNVLEEHGAEAAISLMFMEEFLPVPSISAPVIASIAIIETQSFTQAFLQVFIILAVIGSLAQIASSYVTYGIAWWGGETAVKKLEPFTGIKMEEIRSHEEKMISGREHLYIAGLRAIPLMPLSVISAAAGFFKVKPFRYGLWSFIGMVPRNLLLGMIGWAVGEKFLSHTASLELASYLLAAVVVATIAAGVLPLKRIFKRVKTKASQYSPPKAFLE